ncbi:MAG TPA: NAD-dependent epimerase/dehydratase family protein [Verrucomicrobiae bacterium]|nr:NAD-dependent epimerase/dehydratase family protein [Verrucomicrobiae bacterium]
MKVLITGVCGFVGSEIARGLAARGAIGGNVTVSGIDNFTRAGSELNRRPLKAAGIDVIHGDLRLAEDLDSLPAVDWVIDAAALPSVLAGLGNDNSSRRLMSHNLVSTVNILEYCKRHKAGLILLSTSRVYNVPRLAGLPVREEGRAFTLDTAKPLPDGISGDGISEDFSTEAPVSLYGSTKLASEQIALEYGEAFGFPVWINRCGVLAGAGQFGRIDQGILSFWLHSYKQRRRLEYIGFGGKGYQVRDFLHPSDLLSLIVKQFGEKGSAERRIFNAGGGKENTLSLRAMSDWCEQRFGAHTVLSSDVSRPYDIPWVVMDSDRASKRWGWSPAKPVGRILEEIAAHADSHPDWLSVSQ